MKSTFSLAGLAFAGAAMGAICNNNCGRQVAGTAKKSPDFEARQSQCVAFLATTTTVTPAAATITQAPEPLFVRNVHGPRDEAPVVTGVVPEYASACADVTAYWSACQCFSGLAPTTITETAATPTVTVTGPQATCTQGLEFAVFQVDRNSAQGQQLFSAAVSDINGLQVPELLQGKTPVAGGVTDGKLGIVGQSSGDFQIYGQTLAQGVEGSIVEHRGYFHPDTTGTFTIVTDVVDDILAVWLRERAVSHFNIQNADFSRNWATGFGSNSFTFPVTAGEFIPFRLLWADSDGPGSMDTVSILDASGNVILGMGTPKNHQVIINCSGEGAPSAAAAWPAWQDEQIS